MNMKEREESNPATHKKGDWLVFMALSVKQESEVEVNFSEENT